MSIGAGSVPGVGGGGVGGGGGSGGGGEGAGPGGGGGGAGGGVGGGGAGGGVGGDAGGIGARQGGPAVRCEERAARAEETIERLTVRIAELEGELDRVGRGLREAERLREVERAVTEAGAVDAEAVGLMVVRMIEEQGAADVGAAVRELMRRKPVLFRSGRTGGVMGERGGPGASGSGKGLSGLAEEAQRSGNRQALMEYLREKRERGE